MVLGLLGFRSDDRLGEKGAQNTMVLFQNHALYRRNVEIISISILLFHVTISGISKRNHPVAQTCLQLLQEIRTKAKNHQLINSTHISRTNCRSRNFSLNVVYM